MNLYIVLASIGALALVSLVALNFSNLTGMFSARSVEGNETTTDAEVQQACPASCNDNNPCTLDYCNETTGYICSNVPLNGSVEGCGSSSSCVYNVCLSGKCVVLEKEACCGNSKCESGEGCFNCPQDCECVELPDSQSEQAQTTQSTEQQPNTTSVENNQPLTVSTSTNATSLLNHLTINEVQIGDKEFVELYNPTPSVIDTTGWYLSYFSSKKDWNNTQRNWAFQNITIQSGKYFLVNIYNTPDADWTVLTATGQPYSTGQISTNGSVAVFPFNPNMKSIEEAKNGRVDAVAWGNPDHVYEGSPAQVPSSDKSLERKSLATDTDDNSNDFAINAVPTPKNSSNQ
ncbi:MAG: lamin tail domain-containing protein [Candidatus Aenigmarchaeota archaeon]|nr:lamin tail domain-containing protein [Candidatus Aenigmarchaeota archaeon]